MKNFLKIIITTIFLNVIFIVGIYSVSALEYPALTDINLNNISSLTNYTDNYIVDYAPSTNILSISFFNRDYAYIDAPLSSSALPLYENDICTNYNNYIGELSPCFATIWSTRSGETSSSLRLNGVYESTDYGETWTVKYNSGVSFSYQAGGGTSNYIIKSTVNIYGRSSSYQSTLFYSNTFVYSPLPDYLTGYKKISLTGVSYNEIRYYAISGITSGSVYVPYEHAYNYGGGLQYNNSTGISDWSAVVQDYYIMEDNLYVRYDFNIDNYPNAEFVLYSKYFYFEGIDYPSVDIYVPTTSYTSEVVVSNNNQGGNNFEFDWEDSQGNINNENQITKPINYNPLLPDFLQDFSSNTFGLTSIITSPLLLISTLTSTTCTELSLPLPFTNSNLTLPCMSTIYSNVLGGFFNTYQLLTFGFVSYWVIVRIFNLVKDFKNPDHDEIEVLDL